MHIQSKLLKHTFTMGTSSDLGLPFQDKKVEFGRRSITAQYNCNSKIKKSWAIEFCHVSLKIINSKI